MANPVGSPIQCYLIVYNKVLVHVDVLAEDRIAGWGVTGVLLLTETVEIGIT